MRYFILGIGTVFFLIILAATALAAVKGKHTQDQIVSIATPLPRLSMNRKRADQIGRKSIEPLETIVEEPDLENNPHTELDSHADLTVNDIHF